MVPQEKHLSSAQPLSCLPGFRLAHFCQFGSGVAVAALVAAGYRNKDHLMSLLRQERQGTAGIIFSIIRMGSKDQYSFHARSLIDV